MILVERARVLRERVEQAAQARPRLAVQRVGVRRGDHVGAGLVHLAVNGEGSLVQRVATLHDVAVVVHQQQVRHLDLAESDAERIDPEMIGPFRVASSDMSGHAFLEAEHRERSVHRCQSFLAVLALGLDRVERRGLRDRDLGERVCGGVGSRRHGHHRTTQGSRRQRTQSRDAEESSLYSHRGEQP